MNKIFESAYIYALLIFLGFFNYYSYYNHFDINIATFLSPGELLLSFLPLTRTILIFASIFVILYINAIVSDAIDNKRKERTERIPHLFLTNRIWVHLKDTLANTELKILKKTIFVFINIIGLLISIAFILFFIGYIFYFLFCVAYNDYTASIGNLIFYGIFWFLLFDDLITRFYKDNNKSANIFRVFLLILFSVGLISISNGEDAKNILNGESKKVITFEYNNEIVESNGNTVFVGKTEKYLFLRNLKEKQNYIYPIDKVGMIQMHDSK